MPYFQIKQLLVLETYLELLGINEIANLPEGKGNLPRELKYLLAQYIMTQLIYYPLHLSPTNSKMKPTTLATQL